MPMPLHAGLAAFAAKPTKNEVREFTEGDWAGFGGAEGWSPIEPPLFCEMKKLWHREPCGFIGKKSGQLTWGWALVIADQNRIVLYWEDPHAEWEEEWVLGIKFANQAQARAFLAGMPTDPKEFMALGWKRT